MSTRTTLLTLLVVGIVLLHCGSAMATETGTLRLGNRVWLDLNSDGAQDTGEPGIVGAVVTLTDAAGLVVTPSANPATTFNDPFYVSNTGFYIFMALDANVPYTVTVNLSAAYLLRADGITRDPLPANLVGTSTVPNAADGQTAYTATVTLTASRMDVDFGYNSGEDFQPLYSLGDRVWEDVNNSQTADTDGNLEPGINGVVVNLTGTETDGNVPVSKSTTTAGNGDYLFTELAAGTYTVTVKTTGYVDGGGNPLPSPLAGYTCTWDLAGPKDSNSGSVTLPNTVEPDAPNNWALDFSYYKPVVCGKVSISGFVFNDSDADGNIDAGEPVLPGPTIKLFNATSGAQVGSQIAAADGSFLFKDLPAGLYRLTETNLPDYRSTNAIGGLAGSRVDNDTIAVAATTPGTHYPNQDFLDTGTKPGVDLVKTSISCAKRGEKVTYHFVVTNTGNTWLYGGVTVNDPMLNDATGKIWHKTPVAPGEVNEFDVDYTIPTYGDLTNGVSGSAYNMKVQCTTPPPPPTEEILINTATAIGCPPYPLCKVYDTSSWTIKINACEVRPYTTYTQGGWGACPSGNNPGTVLKNNWYKVYKCNGLIVGSCKTLRFDNSWEVCNFLPQGGTAGRLNRSYNPPTCRTSAGVLAGQVLALRLNVDFSNAGVTRTGLGNLKIQSGTYYGWTVGAFLAKAQKVLGASDWATVSTINDVATKINECFDNGTTNTGYVK